LTTTTYTVHARGDGWAEITEGNKVSRGSAQRYTWDAAAGHRVSAVHPELQHLGVWQRLELHDHADGTGSRIEVDCSPERLWNQGKLVAACSHWSESA
jgi:hypothetical protein